MASLFAHQSDLTVSTGSTYTTNQGTIDVIDGAGSGIVVSGTDTTFEDSNDSDQVLDSDVTIGAFSFSAGDFIQAEEITFVTFADGSSGQIISLNIRDDSFTDGSYSTGLFAIFKEDPISGDLEPYMPAQGEAIPYSGRDGTGSVDYARIVCFAEGAPTESLFTGPEALKAIPPAALHEITAIFPELVTTFPNLSPRDIPHCQLAPFPRAGDRSNLRRATRRTVSPNYRPM